MKHFTAIYSFVNADGKDIKDMNYYFPSENMNTALEFCKNKFETEGMYKITIVEEN